MDVTAYMKKHGHEQLIVCYDKKTGFRGYIGIHSTALGPGLGGIRFWNYKAEEEAIIDVLRLSEGMSYKAAVAGLKLGGGKMVVWGDPKTADRDEVYRTAGKFIETLKGHYIGAEDVSTTTQDLVSVYKHTKHLVGMPKEMGGSGDPSPVTAFGVHKGMIACVEEVFSRSELKGLKVGIQGVGHVGYNMCKILHKEGCELIIADVNQEAVDKCVKEFNAKAVSPEEIFDADMDIFCPCALGACLNPDTIKRLKCKIIAGSANNQLCEKEEEDMKLIQEKGILYAPDYVINAGGLINVSDESDEGGYNRERALVKAAKIYDNLKDVIKMAKEKGITTNKAAHEVALARIKAAE